MDVAQKNGESVRFPLFRRIPAIQQAMGKRLLSREEVLILTCDAIARSITLKERAAYNHHHHHGFPADGPNSRHPAE